MVPDENSLPSLQMAVLLYLQLAKKGSSEVSSYGGTNLIMGALPS